MYNNGYVVSASQFHTWAGQQEKLYAAIKPYMNRPDAKGGAPYAHSYLPAPGGGAPPVRAG
jgi:hypothetical protein